VSVALPPPPQSCLPVKARINFISAWPPPSPPASSPHRRISIWSSFFEELVGVVLCCIWAPEYLVLSFSSRNGAVSIGSPPKKCGPSCVFRAPPRARRTPPHTPPRRAIPFPSRTPPSATPAEISPSDFFLLDAPHSKHLMAISADGGVFARVPFLHCTARVCARAFSRAVFSFFSVRNVFGPPPL